MGGILTAREGAPVIFCERFEYEHTYWDPKDGELLMPTQAPNTQLLLQQIETNCVEKDGFWLASFMAIVETQR